MAPGAGTFVCLRGFRRRAESRPGGEWLRRWLRDARLGAGRRLFPSIWFDAETCSAGLDALGWYHENQDEARNIGLGPEHDWSSHGADAFGLMCVAYEAPTGYDDNEDIDLRDLALGRSPVTGY